MMAADLFISSVYSRRLLQKRPIINCNWPRQKSAVIIQGVCFQSEVQLSEYQQSSKLGCFRDRVRLGAWGLAL